MYKMVDSSMKKIKLFIAAGLAAVMVCCLFKPQPSATADEISDIQQGYTFSDIYKNILMIFLFALVFFVIGTYKTSREEKKININ